MKKSVRFIMFQVMAGGASPAMTFIDFEKESVEYCQYDDKK